MQYQIGIDSGGTHVEAEAWAEDGTLLGTASAGPGNSLLNYEQTFVNLETVIETLLNQNKVHECQLILAGVAGSQSANNQTAIEAYLLNRFSIPVRIISDADLAMLKGFGYNSGILVIAGTGSIVLGQEGPQRYRIGGWGHLLGDEGGAYDIVKRCYQQMTQELNQQLETGPMTTLILTALNYVSPTEAISDFYQMSRQQIAAQARILAEQGQNNEQFKSVIEVCANQLAQQIQLMRERFLTDKPIKIALTGSVLTHNQLLKHHVEEQVAQKSTVQFVTLEGSNAAGVKNFIMEDFK